MAFVSSASRGNNPARSLFIPDRNYSLTKYLADADGGSKRILPSRQTAAAGISRICRKIDSRVNVRIDTQPPGYGSEPHLDFIVTDLDGMLARLCGPDRENNPVKGQARNLFIPDRQAMSPRRTVDKYLQPTTPCRTACFSRRHSPGD